MTIEELSRLERYYHRVKTAQPLTLDEASDFVILTKRMEMDAQKRGEFNFGSEVLGGIATLVLKSLLGKK